MKYNLTPEEMPVIAIDFDGVIVEDRWPEIGPAIPGAIETINQWYEDGFWIIINSCRDQFKDGLGEWMYIHDCHYHAINLNLPWRIAKYNTDPRKIGADIYIDDRNIKNCGCPVDEMDWKDYAECVDLIAKQKERALCEE